MAAKLIFAFGHGFLEAIGALVVMGILWPWGHGGNPQA